MKKKLTHFESANYYWTCSSRFNANLYKKDGFIHTLSFVKNLTDFYTSKYELTENANLLLLGLMDKIDKVLDSGTLITNINIKMKEQYIGEVATKLQSCNIEPSKVDFIKKSLNALCDENCILELNNNIKLLIFASELEKENLKQFIRLCSNKIQDFRDLSKANNVLNIFSELENKGDEIVPLIGELTKKSTLKLLQLNNLDNILDFIKTKNCTQAFLESYIQYSNNNTLIIEQLNKINEHTLAFELFDQLTANSFVSVFFWLVTNDFAAAYKIVDFDNKIYRELSTLQRNGFDLINAIRGVFPKRVYPFYKLLMEDYKRKSDLKNPNKLFLLNLNLH